MPKTTEQAVMAEIDRLAPEWRETIRLAAAAIVAGDRQEAAALLNVATLMAMGTCPHWWT